jgi:hypothetical protein
MTGHIPRTPTPYDDAARLHYAMLEMCIPRAEQLAMHYSWNKYMVTKCVQKTETRCIDRSIFDSAVAHVCR